MRLTGWIALGLSLGFGLVTGPSVSPAAAADREFAVEVFGELAGSDRILVVVPGSDVDRQHFAGLHAMATAVYAEAADQADQAEQDDRVAVVAWAGYRTPVGIGIDAARSDLAEAGAARLLDYLGSLSAYGGTVGLLCHSYGTVVCARAAPGFASTGADVRDLVAFASPGMDVDTVEDLGTAAHVWVARSPSDWVGWVPKVRFFGVGHGRDPLDPAFGATAVPVRDAEGHAGYLAPGTASLHTLTAAALGLEPAAVSLASAGVS